MVRGGRLVLDEPSDLPDGTQVSLLATELHAADRARAGRAGPFAP